MTMPDSTALPYVGLRYDDMPDLWDGFARLVRPALGITAFGVNVMDLPPDYETEAHDERDTGQEELYVALEGSGAVVVDGGPARLDFDPERAVRVGPETPRTLVSGPDGMRVLVVRATPGEPYTAPQ
jgi:hypothetical protein